MNQTQRKYLAKRITEIELSKIKKIQDKFTTKAKTLLSSEKVSLLKAGKVKINTDEIINEISKCNSYVYISQFTDFSAYETLFSVDHDAINKATGKIKKEAKRLVDDVILGDANEALEALKSFEEMEI